MNYQQNMQQMPQQDPVQGQSPMMHQPQPNYPQHQQKNPVPQLQKGALSHKVQQLFVLFYTALSIILTARFIFSLLGSNLNSPFVSFIYQLSQPFVTPFSNMFGVTFQAGQSRIEFEDLVALLVFALVFFGIAKIISIIFD